MALGSAGWTWRDYHRVMTTPVSLRIDFVSDIACPWCAVGLSALERALQRLDGTVSAELHFQPFELNPHMGPEGEDVAEHLTKKYGSTAEQQSQIRETIRQRGAQEGFEFRAAGRGRIWNTFDAHRLLHWAGEEGAPGQQHALKKALLVAYHGCAENPSDTQVLLACVREVGLDESRAQAILDGDEFADTVREREQFYTANGIRSVPAVIINERHLISGGHPSESFEQALRQIAGQV